MTDAPGPATWERRPGGRAAAVVVVLALAAGCGKTDGRAGLSGSVTLAGEPLDGGVIELHPQGGGGPAGGAMIVAGRYEMPRKQGVPPGVYRVVIRAQAEQPAGQGSQSRPDMAPEDAAPPAEPPPRSRIPAAFGDESTATVSLEAGTANTFDVAIP